MKLKPIIHFLFVFASALSFVYLVPQSFIHSESIVHVLTSVLKLKVDPSFTGGETVARFLDPLGDDNGSGLLTYPSHPAWNDTGLLDMVAYEVHEPVTQANWSELPYYWQLDCSFAKLPNGLGGSAGFSFPVINIYIDIDGEESGSVSTLRERGEMVRFDGRYPWDYMVHIDGFSPKGTLYKWDGGQIGEVPVYIDVKTATIKARLPLEDEGLMRILDGRVTRHYVLVGAYDQLSTENFMNVTRRGGVHAGGGADSPFTPKVYDFLAPRGENQQTLLSSFARDGSELALLTPVIADPAARNRVIPEAEMKKLEDLATAEEAKAAENAGGERAPDVRPEDMSDEDWLITLFNAGRGDEAYDLAAILLQKNPDDGIVLAYAGSLEALKAGSASEVAESIRLVNKAYDQFAKAEAILQTDGDLLHLYFNRGYVALSVPEIVFNKGAQGGDDFMSAARILRDEGADDVQIADAYINAGDCYTKALKDIKAEAAYNAALSLDGKNARQKLALAKLGFY